MSRLTCLIPCKDESHNIADCVESLNDIADEILICDSGSSDGTPELALAAATKPCRVVAREYIHSGDFKNWGIPQATHDWVLIVDADERITPELRAEITRVLSSDNSKDGYWIYRANHFLGQPIRFGGLQNDCCLRLFRRDLGRYVGPNDHAEVHVSSGKVGRLKHRMLHYSITSYDDYLRKLHRYTTYQAKVWHERGVRPRYIHMLLRPIIRFVRDYVVQLGFLDGKVGLQYAAMQAWYAFMKQARLYERHHNPGAEQASTSITRAA